MEQTTATPNLNKALVSARGKFPAIPKGRTATVRMKNDKGEYSYDYADLCDVLDVVQPILAEHGLIVTHDQRTTREPLGVETVAVLIHESGEEKRGGMLWLPCSTDMQPTQAIGSALTYGRRYTTGPILGISPESDDDGNGAAGNDATTKRKEPKPVCPACGKNDFVYANKPEKGPGFYCWKKPELNKHGCGHNWNPEESAKSEPFLSYYPGIENNEGNVSPVYKKSEPKPAPKTDGPKVSEELRALLKEIGCKSRAEADAVIRLCTSSKHDIDGAENGHSDACRTAIEMTLAMHMRECGTREKALPVVYADALSQVEK